MARRQRDLAKEARWRARLGRHATSGLSVREFCQRERVAESAFYFWRRVIAERDDAKAAPAARIASAKRSASAAGRTLPAFVPAVVTGLPSGGGALAIELAGGRVLRLPEAISAARLAELVHAIESPAPRSQEPRSRGQA